VRKNLVVATALFVFARGTPSFAQGDSSSDASRLRVRIGPLTINPTIGLTNIGVDLNVFNETADQNPKRDFTFTVTPAVELRLRVVRTVVTGSVNESLIWYQRYTSERAANSAFKVGWLVPFNRVSLKMNARRASVKDRPGFEIDARSPRTESGYDGSIEVRAMPKTFVGVTAQWQRTAFGTAAVFLNSNLQFELNRVTTGAGVSLRYKWTPLTSISLVATRTQDRFEFSSLRDSNSTAASAVIAFDPLGILSGSAKVGYTSFEPVASGLPNFKGATAAVNVSYRLLGTMRISVAAIRDVAYSYDVNQPYYVQTGVSGSVSRAVVGPVDVVVRAGIQSLAYRDRVGAVVEVSNRVDTVPSYGGGVGYHMGKASRLGFNVDKTNRISDVSRRQYDDLRFGSSVTYGF
jgi:hypothetical protein